MENPSFEQENSRHAWPDNVQEALIVRHCSAVLPMHLRTASSSVETAMGGSNLFIQHTLISNCRSDPSGSLTHRWDFGRQYTVTFTKISEVVSMYDLCKPYYLVSLQSEESWTVKEKEYISEKKIGISPTWKWKWQGFAPREQRRNWNISSSCKVYNSITLIIIILLWLISLIGTFDARLRYQCKYKKEIEEGKMPDTYTASFQTWA